MTPDQIEQIAVKLSEAREELTIVRAAEYAIADILGHRSGTIRGVTAYDVAMKLLQHLPEDESLEALLGIATAAKAKAESRLAAIKLPE